MLYFWRDRSRTAASLHYLPWGMAAAEAVAKATNERTGRLFAAQLTLIYGHVLWQTGKFDDAERVFRANLLP
jgi:hypothetical protein